MAVKGLGKKPAARVILWLGLILWAGTAWGLVRLAFYLPYPPEEKWEAEYGWTGATAVDRVSPELMVGQAVIPPGPLSRLEVRFATYGRRPVGHLRAVVLRGTKPPAARAEIRRRAMVRQTIKAESIQDSGPYALYLPRIRYDWDQGFYLLIQGLEDNRPTPVTLWVDQAREWPGPKADLLAAPSGGAVLARRKAPGHLSLKLVQDGFAPTLYQGFIIYWGRPVLYLLAAVAAGLLVGTVLLLFRTASALGPVWSYAAVILVCLLLMEGTARVYMYHEIQTPLSGPMNLGIYRRVEGLRREPVQREAGRINILLLGGSVLYQNWGRVGEFLEAELKEVCKPVHVRVVNLARTAHSSLDSLIKYRLLEDSRFDLVFVYHGINETRNNNVPPELFRDDYSHTEFYADIAVPEAHPESAFFRLPAVLHRMYNNFMVTSGLRQQLGMREHDKWVEYGCDIKTDRPFRHNLNEMAEIARQRGETLILSTFAIHIPPDYSLEKFKAQELDYAGHRSPIQLWGRPRCVAKGVAAHNRVVKELAQAKGLGLVDLDRYLPRNRENFDDVCHLTPAGSQAFVKIMLPVVVKALAGMEFEGKPRVPGLAGYR